MKWKYLSKLIPIIFIPSAVVVASTILVSCSDNSKQDSSNKPQEKPQPPTSGSGGSGGGGGSSGGGGAPVRPPVQPPAPPTNSGGNNGTVTKPQPPVQPPAPPTSTNGLFNANSGTLNNGLSVSSYKNLIEELDIFKTNLNVLSGITNQSIETQLQKLKNAHPQDPLLQSASITITSGSEINKEIQLNLQATGINQTIKIEGFQQQNYKNFQILNLNNEIKFNEQVYFEQGINIDQITTANKYITNEDLLDLTSMKVEIFYSNNQVAFSFNNLKELNSEFEIYDFNLSKYSNTNLYEINFKLRKIFKIYDSISNQWVVKKQNEINVIVNPIPNASNLINVLTLKDLLNFICKQVAVGNESEVTKHYSSYYLGLFEKGQGEGVILSFLDYRTIFENYKRIYKNKLDNFVPIISSVSADDINGVLNFSINLYNNLDNNWNEPIEKNISNFKKIEINNLKSAKNELILNDSSNIVKDIKTQFNKEINEVNSSGKTYSSNLSISQLQLLKQIQTLTPDIKQNQESKLEFIKKNITSMSLLGVNINDMSNNYGVVQNNELNSFDLDSHLLTNQSVNDAFYVNNIILDYNSSDQMQITIRKESNGIVIEIEKIKMSYSIAYSQSFDSIISYYLKLTNI